MTPPGAPDEKITGDGWWIAERNGDRATLLEAFGEWGQRELTTEISIDDFEQLRDPKKFSQISRKYNEVRGEGWTARRADGCSVEVNAERSGQNHRFDIPPSAFERLQADPQAFDEVYSTYGTGRYRNRVC